jgi:sterol 24-C-methyltransferase
MWKYIVWASTGKTSPDPDSIITNDGNKRVKTAIGDYLHTFDEKDKGRDEGKITERKEGYKSLVRNYYDLVTDFYEYGWGEAFHFAPRYQWESFDDSLRRHEYYLAARLGLKPGLQVLDLGCGVGGPMRNIVRFSGAQVTGVTICQYQVERANALNAKYGVSTQCRAEFGDFMNLGPERKGKFDAAYGIEATCHAPDRAKCFREAYEALKPGGVFAVYEWAMTPLYDPENAEHRLIKHEIEKGDSLPDLTSQEAILDAFRQAGFVIEDSYDVAIEYKSRLMTIEWYATLQGSLRLSQIKHSKLGRFLTQRAVEILETMRVAPEGTSDTHAMLSKAAEYLARGGETGIFTPMLFVLARKPL